MSHTFGRHFTERRRASLAVRPAGQPFQLEPRTTMTEPISITALSLEMLPAFLRSALSASGGGLAHNTSLSENSVTRANPASPSGDTWSHARSVGLQGQPIAASMSGVQASGGVGASTDPTTSPRATGLRVVTPGPDVIGSLGAGSAAGNSDSAISLPWNPVGRAGGGGALPPRGGSPAVSGAMTAASGHHSSAGVSQNNGATAPSSSSSAAAASALLSTLGMSGLQAGSQVPVAHGSSATASQTTISRNASAIALNGGRVTSTPGHGLRPLTSPAFELDTLDYNDGTVMVPPAGQPLFRSP
jgi:hypothetical protein